MQSYDSLLKARRLRPDPLFPDERRARVDELLAVADRELADAAIPGRSADGAHNSAYAAGRAAAEAVMCAEGFRRGSGEGQHAIIFEFLGLVSDGMFGAESDLLNRARRLRNQTEYEKAGLVSPSAAEALQSVATAFLASVRAWLAENHPEPEPTSPDDALPEEQ